MNTLRTIALLLATLTSGLLAGLYYGYANSVMPALGQADNKTMIDVMQKINVAIINPVFMLSFLGAPVITIGAAAMFLGKDMRSVLGWVVAAAVLNIAGTVVTFALNIPLNDQLDAAGDPNQITDLAGVRGDFFDAWVRWNIVRLLLHTAAFGALAWSLILLGRRTV
ncbi:DUF1772 domain-containing protein [Antrihabitans sp. YC2-6]|uniref:anthrone oxygenase family protein n=1 Tax=Antrihabitans sp. YC2-6 TaxID=2799498 RepID=UPI0018F53558|nr:anthrone oxygenase family protein [Antrihabitans sp. YC2-6]MBJ8345955.1 DUF1772 domain-containing protein [Antrihabitans sp. YC2-6]